MRENMKRFLMYWLATIVLVAVVLSFFYGAIWLAQTFPLATMIFIGLFITLVMAYIAMVAMNFEKTSK